MNKALNDLIELGSTKKEIKAFGKKWAMHTLSSKDQLAAANSTSEYDTLSRVVALKIAIISNAVTTVDGQSLGNKSERRELFGKLPIPVINHLYNEYEKLLDSQNDALNNLLKEDEKDTIETEDDEEENKVII